MLTQVRIELVKEAGELCHWQDEHGRCQLPASVRVEDVPYCLEHGEQAADAWEGELF